MKSSEYCRGVLLAELGSLHVLIEELHDRTLVQSVPVLPVDVLQCLHHVDCILRCSLAELIDLSEEAKLVVKHLAECEADLLSDSHC